MLISTVKGREKDLEPVANFLNQHITFQQNAEVSNSAKAAKTIILH